MCNACGNGLLVEYDGASCVAACSANYTNVNGTCVGNSARRRRRILTPADCCTNASANCSA